MESFNLFEGELGERQERPGWSWSAATLGPLLGAERMGASLYELDPGSSSFPYHYEHGCEEWLLCVSGTPTLRAPDGEQQLRPGDVVVFPEGPAGAHLIRNDTSEPARVLILSTKARPAVAVYPDSGKLGVWASGEDAIVVRQADAVDYWNGEA
jgi:uncharacterized cupin superfamily protein